MTTRADRDSMMIDSSGCWEFRDQIEHASIAAWDLATESVPKLIADIEALAPAPAKMTVAEFVARLGPPDFREVGWSSVEPDRVHIGWFPGGDRENGPGISFIFSENYSEVRWSESGRTMTLKLRVRIKPGWQF